MGPNFQAPLIAIQSLIEPRDIATATASFGFIRNLANAISVVIGGVIFQNRMKNQASTLSSLPPAILDNLSSGSAGASTAVVQSLPVAQKNVVVEAYTSSLQTLWIFYTVVGFAGALVSLCITKNKLAKHHAVTKTGLDVQKEGRRKDLAMRELKRKGDKGVEAGDSDLADAEKHIVESDGVQNNINNHFNLALG